MLRSKVFKRAFSGYENVLFNAREDVNKLLEHQDRSSYILAQYIPEPARDAYIAIRGFNLEINKIHGTNTRASSQLSSTMGVSTTDMKFRFWNDLLARIFTNPMSDSNIGEPIAILLRDAIRKDLNLDISYFHRFLQTRKHFLNHPSFATVDDICAYGEGTYSQLNYLTQGLLLSPGISPSVINLLEHSPPLQSLVSDIAAHIGQATSIGSMILAMNYYAGQNRITLPIDTMTKYELSQETLVRLCQGHIKEPADISDAREKLKNIIYDVATTANDHMLTARDKLAKAQAEIQHVVATHPHDGLVQQQYKSWRKHIPDVIFTPFMVGIPTSLYLNKLQRHDFDIFGKNLQKKEWRLAWTSYRNYYKRQI